MGRPRGQTRGRVVGAAFQTLRTKGYAGATTRAIAEIGGFQPGLIFYYFDSLDDLLVAALAESSAERLERYRAAVGEADSLQRLLEVLGDIYRDDVESGHIRVVSELVGASVSRPELAERVVALMQPWLELAEATVADVLRGSPLAELASARDLALAAVTFYLGANLLTHLVPSQADVTRLLEAAQRLAPLFEAASPASRPSPRRR
jgi:AcrR family transcriptional regulator